MITERLAEVAAEDLRVGDQVACVYPDGSEQLRGKLAGGPTLTGSGLLWPVQLFKGGYLEGTQVFVSVVLVNAGNLRRVEGVRA